ncbi:MAG: lanthionine synthetase LanC family protein [Vicinamibacteraceae bacterium]
MIRTLICCVMPILVSLPPPLAPERPHLAAALDAARFIQTAAIATARGATWLANPADTASASADLYTGSAGVVLFFLELDRTTGDAGHLKAARSGADELLAAIDRETDPGLYTGLAGVGFVLSEVARHTGTAAYRDGARRVVETLRTRAVARGAGVEWNDTTDVISGSAGIGLFLLYAADALAMPEARDLAARAGRRLIERGQDDAGGRKWPMDGTSTQRLPNFSHGTAGVAYFLATLYQATRDRTFLDAALAGAHYLQAIAETGGDVCLIFHHEPDAEGRRLHYLGWCHGPAGTARLWYRLWQATGDRVWLDWVAKSARAILASGIPERQTPGFWTNVGVCCGSAGVAEFFLAHYRATGDAASLAFARRVSAQILAAATRDATGIRWPHAEHRTRPTEIVAQTGWMQGAAGIGAWFLHLDAFERGAAPPITFPDSPF